MYVWDGVGMYGTRWRTGGGLRETPYEGYYGVCKLSSVAFLTCDMLRMYYDRAPVMVTRGKRLI